MLPVQPVPGACGHPCMTIHDRCMVTDGLAGAGEGDRAPPHAAHTQIPLPSMLPSVLSCEVLHDTDSTGCRGDARRCCTRHLTQAKCHCPRCALLGPVLGTWQRPGAPGPRISWMGSELACLHPQPVSRGKHVRASAEECRSELCSHRRRQHPRLGGLLPPPGVQAQLPHCPSYRLPQPP